MGLGDPRRRPILFAALLALALAIRLLFVFILPCGQTIRFRLEGLNDEPSHYNYVRYLAEHREFPVQTASARDPDAFQRNEFEYYQPPAYYLIGGALHAALGYPGSLYAARLFSALLGLLSLLLIWRIVTRLGLPPAVREGSVLFAALWPNLAYFSSMVSNDSLSWFVGLLLTDQLLDDRPLLPPGRRGELWRRSAILLLLLALGMLVKTSLFLFFPPVALMYGVAYRRTRDRAVLGAAVLAVCGSLAVVAPWYLRNLHLYHSFSGIEVGNGPEQRYLFEARWFVKFLKDASRYFWFPMQHIFPTNPRRVLWLLGACLLAGNIALTARFYRRRRRFSAREAYLLLLFICNAVAFLQYNLLWRNSEGRFFFPSLAAMLLFFTLPLYDWLAERGATRFFLILLAAEALWPYLNLLLKLGYG